MVNCNFESCTHYTPAKLHPDELELVQELVMRPGGLSNDGFLDQTEDLLTVFETDIATLKQYGVTHFELGDALDNLAKQTLKCSSNQAVIDHFRITVIHNEDEGLMKCPFQTDPDKKSCHFGRRLFTLINTRSRQELQFSELAIGLIRDHGFFEGSTKFRVDVKALCDILGYRITDPDNS